MRRLSGWVMIVGLLAAVAVGGCTRKPSESRSQVRGGLRFEYGLILGADLRGHDTQHPEATMHGGPPLPADNYHIVLALFDARSGARVSDAEVAMSLAGPGHHGGGALPMDAMPVPGQESYGLYVVLPDPGTYRVTFDARRAGASPSHVKAAFSLERPG